VAEHVDLRVTHGGEVTVGLVLLLAELRMERSEHKIQPAERLRFHVPVPRRRDVHLEGSKDAEVVSGRLEDAVDLVDLPALLGELGFVHAARDLQTLRMVRDRDVRVVELDAMHRHRLNRKGTVAVDGVHLEVP
jgi:hypothetical protein